MDILLRCNRCKTATPTVEYKIIDQDVTREKKSGEKSTTNRKVIKGICGTCNAKKHMYADKEGKIKEKLPIIEEKPVENDDFTEEEITISKSKGYSKAL